MPDLINYSVTRLSNASLSVPRWQVQGQIVDSQTQQTVIADITAANIVFPTVLGQLSTTEQDDWVNGVVQQLIFKRFGLG
jgi:hypothetical protein